MFSKSKKEPGNKPAAQGPRQPSAPSILSADLRLVGDLNSEGEVQVDGSIDGDIRTKILLIGESATVKGKIVGDTVRVYGKVDGQIKARAVILAKSARVFGNILHENLSVEAGAFLDGHCKRMGEGASPKAARALPWMRSRSRRTPDASSGSRVARRSIGRTGSGRAGRFGSI